MLICYQNKAILHAGAIKEFHQEQPNGLDELLRLTSSKQTLIPTTKTQIQTLDNN